MLVLVDDFLMNMLFICTMAFVGSIAIFIILAMKCPGQVWVVIKSWLFKKVLDIAATDTLSLRFIPRNRREEGQLEAQKGKFKSVKVMPRTSNPLFANTYHLEGTGIATVLSYEGKSIAVGPEAVAAMHIVEMSKEDREKLPPEIKRWAKEVKIPVDELVKLKDSKTGEEKEVVKTKYQMLFSLDPRKLKTYFEEAYDENQFTHMLEEEFLKGQGLKPKGMGGKLIPIGIILIFVFILIWLLSSGVIKF